ncbi:MAG: YegS/Rv2252/BmrU family lipid kinase [Clostridia bacterium]|nr:YegS/Rv2252/BmrU family lipid kinase [Clostridia bacterium]
MHYIIVNRTKLTPKTRIKLAKAEAVFKAAQIPYEIRQTEYKGHAGEITKELTSSGEEVCIVAVGGDGTLHEILNGIVDFEKTSLALIPLGTGNDFAKTAGIPKLAKKAATIIAQKQPKYVDFIELTSGVRSINAVGMGIDVDVLKRVYSGKSKRKSKYLHALIVSLAKFKSYNFTVKYNGKEEEHFGLICGLGNGKQFGGGIKLFPDAEISDGYIDLVIADYFTKRQTIGAFLKLMRGKINKVKQITAVKVKEAEFIFHGENMTIQADGELYENTPLTAHIVENKLKFYLP